MGKRLLFLLCLTLASFCSSPASAAPQTIIAEGTCIVGDTDAPKDARDAARKEALRAATEQAGVYVESYTEAKNLTLTKDEGSPGGSHSRDRRRQDMAVPCPSHLYGGHRRGGRRIPRA